MLLIKLGYFPKSNQKKTQSITNTKYSILASKELVLVCKNNIGNPNVPLTVDQDLSVITGMDYYYLHLTNEEILLHHAAGKRLS